MEPHPALSQGTGTALWGLAMPAVSWLKKWLLMYLGDVLMLGWSKWNRVAWEADLQKRGLHACLGKGFAFICSLVSLL